MYWYVLTQFRISETPIILTSQPFKQTSNYAYKNVKKSLPTELPRKNPRKHQGNFQNSYVEGKAQSF